MARTGSGTVYSREYRIFVQQLVAARHRKGMSQRELALRLGKSYSYVSKVEIGATRMDVVQIRQYLTAVEMPFLQFMQDYEQAVNNNQHPEYQHPEYQHPE